MIELEKVRVTFGDSKHAVTALEETSLRIDHGEFVALVGPSGCGKSTILKLVAGTLNASQGHVFVAGREMAVQSIKGGPKAAIARFEGVNDRAAAEDLRGSLVEVDRAALPPLEDGEFYHADVIGLPCVDGAGESVGTVAAVENFGAGDLLEIAKPDGKRTLIPFRAPMAILEAERVVVDPEFLA